VILVVRVVALSPEFLIPLKEKAPPPATLKQVQQCIAKVESSTKYRPQ
jgi:hypothetical protein